MGQGQSAPCHGGCVPFLTDRVGGSWARRPSKGSRGCREQRRGLRASADASPAGPQPRGGPWGGAKDACGLDEVPSRARPRVGSWASPAPWTPVSYGTWSHQVNDKALGNLAAPEPPVEFELRVEGAGGHSAAADHRRRLQETSLPSPAQAAAAPADAAAGGPPAGGPRRRASDFRAEQLLAAPGTLPKCMSAQDRDRALEAQVDRVLGALAAGGSTARRMSRVPRKLLVARGEHGQRLRRGILSGAIVVFFTAGYEGKRFVYERAKALGVRSMVIDAPDSWSRQLLEEGIIEHFIPISMSQCAEAVYAQALEAIRALGQDPRLGEPDGIATVVELSVATAARLAEELGLPGPPPEAVDLARDKHRTRQALRAAGLPTPPFRSILGEADLEAAAREVGFPAVVKPSSGAASLGVKKVERAEDLRSVHGEMDRELRSLVVSSGALVKDDGTGVGISADKLLSTSFVLERYLDGDEVDVDVVMSEGEWQYAAVSDNGPTLEPYFNETWAVSPSLLPRQKQVALKELAISSVKALGFTDGVFHVECKYTSCGPQLIEVNARMGGGPVHKQNLRTWNVDLVEETILCAVGIPCRPDVPREPLECIANSDVNSLRSGRLRDLGFLEPLRGREGVVSFSPHVREGDEVVGPKDGLPTWLVEVVVARPTPREALDFLLDLEAEIQARVHLD